LSLVEYSGLPSAGPRARDNEGANFILDPIGYRAILPRARWNGDFRHQPRRRAKHQNSVCERDCFVDAVGNDQKRGLLRLRQRLEILPQPRTTHSGDLPNPPGDQAGSK
jgi:hypothetical protein